MLCTAFYRTLGATMISYDTLLARRDALRYLPLDLVWRAPVIGYMRSSATNDIRHEMPCAVMQHTAYSLPLVGETR